MTRRTVLADERRRRARSGSPRWAIPGDDPDAVISAEVQGDYHALRRMYDAAKDEPAVTDFYYGEMEMRRRGLWQEFRTRVRERWWRGLTGSFGEWPLRGTDTLLTPAGEWIELVLRLIAPFLLVLALLAIRSRVRR